MFTIKKLGVDISKKNIKVRVDLDCENFSNSNNLLLSNVAIFPNAEKIGTGIGLCGGKDVNHLNVYQKVISSF